MITWLHGLHHSCITSCFPGSILRFTRLDCSELDLHQLLQETYELQSFSLLKAMPKRHCSGQGPVTSRLIPLVPQFGSYERITLICIVLYKKARACVAQSTRESNLNCKMRMKQMGATGAQKQGRGREGKANICMVQRCLYFAQGIGSIGGRPDYRYSLCCHRINW